MRRALLLLLPLFAIGLAGCPKSKPKPGECKSNQDCARQEGYGKICIEGRCAECAQDTDCKAGFVCRQNKCAPRPECERNEDCGPGRECQAGRCQAAAQTQQQSRPECTANDDCGSGRECQAGRCVAAATTQAAPQSAGQCENLSPVYFGFDEYSLSAEARSTLDGAATCLKTVARASVEGHCDERGTTEYNLALGQRRADAVKKYLGNLGVDAGKLKAISYGKERPADPGHDEAAWAKNRRVEIKAGPGVSQR
jgi:peptidoglycan-associated lipoprotein